MTVRVVTIMQTLVIVSSLKGNACWYCDITEHRCYIGMVKKCHKSESSDFRKRLDEV